MTAFVDTSALLALLDEDDQRHDVAAGFWADLAARRERAVTTNYVIVESLAVARRRLGAAAATQLVRRILPVFEVIWVDAELHLAAQEAWLSAGPGGVSLVDQVSFGAMRHAAIRTAFAFDSDFASAGFDVLPPPAARATT